MKFRFTCPSHQQLFFETVRAAGCCDPVAMDEVRRRALAWLSRCYPRLVMDHVRGGTCFACEFEACFGSVREVQAAVEELVKEVLCECCSAVRGPDAEPIR